MSFHLDLYATSWLESFESWDHRCHAEIGDGKSHPINCCPAAFQSIIFTFACLMYFNIEIIEAIVILMKTMNISHPSYLVFFRCCWRLEKLVYSFTTWNIPKGMWKIQETVYIVWHNGRCITLDYISNTWRLYIYL